MILGGAETRNRELQTVVYCISNVSGGVAKL